MKIDQEYLKGLLNVCQASTSPTFTIRDLASAGYDYRDNLFEFHMKIINDQGFIEDDRGRSGFGLIKAADGSSSWSILPLRLTASGHQFIEALANKEVWHVIRHNFKDASMSTLRDVALKLLEGYAKKKVDSLLG